MNIEDENESASSDDQVIEISQIKTPKPVKENKIDKGSKSKTRTNRNASTSPKQNDKKDKSAKKTKGKEKSFYKKIHEAEIS